jgi:hypothetical protein
MCGHGGCKAGGVVIPRQNKDVCRECDKALWRHETTGARDAGARFEIARRPPRPRPQSRYFKWCKGCKNFMQIGHFSQKLDAAKCDKCRERGRTSYLLKKRSGGSATPKAPRGRGVSIVEEDLHENPHLDGAAAISLVALARTGEGRSRSNSMYDDDDASAAEAASAGDLSAVGESAVEAAIAAARGAAPAAPEDDARMSSNFGCSLLQYQRKRSLSEATDDEGASQAGCDAPEPAPAVAVEDDASSQSDKGDAAAEDKGMLFELANIHATIIKLEQRAGQVEPLEARVADLERRLEASAARERLLSDALAKAAPGETPNKLADDAKRPRLISFDDK